MHVDTWAGWHTHGALSLEAIAAQHGEKIEIVKLNTDENPATTKCRRRRPRRSPA